VNFKKILVPIDFSHFSKKALDAATELAKCCGGKIHLLHIEEDIFHVDEIDNVNPTFEKLRDEMHRVFVEQKKRSLEKFKSYIPKKLFAGATIKEGHAFAEIIKFAKNKGIDVIVMSSHGRSELRHALLGSTVDKVSRKAGCAVLIIKHKEHKFLPF